MPEERVRSRVRRDAAAGSCRPRRLHGDRGSIIAEAALLTPFFVTLMFGMLEFGGAFRDYLTVSNSATAAARTAAIEGNTNDADWWILQAVYKNSLAMPKSQILEVEVFSATSNPTATSPPSACTSANLCNDYTGANLQSYLGATVEPTTFSNTCVPGNGTPMSNWCPNLRKVDLQDGVDYVGVYVRVQHPWITGLFGSSVTMTQTRITQLEPQQLSVTG